MRSYRVAPIAALMCLALALLGGTIALVVQSGSSRDVPRLSSGGVAGDLRLEGVRTSIYTDGERRIRASARVAQLVPTHVIGPFSLGISRSVVASDVHIDLPETMPPDRTTDDLAADLIHAAAPAFNPAPRRQPIAGIEMTPVTITRKSSAGPVVLLHAQSCATSLAGTVTCHKGMLREDDKLVRFTYATLDGRRWKITKRDPR